MREMKDSGIEWAGVIPNTWNINKGKYFMELLTRPTLETDEVITCFRDGEVTLRSKRREEGFTVSLTEAGYQGIEIGDLVVHGMDGFAGSIGISDSRGKATPVLNVLDTEQNKRYMMYLMRTMAYCELFLSLATGIRVRTCDTNWKKLREIDYILPTIPEQKAIADFLDEQCAEIDSLISDIQSQIEALEEYKRSVITEAVTKGLDPDVEMRNSGVQWIGEIPTHWTLIRIGSLYGLRTQKVSDIDYPPLSVTKMGVLPQLDTVAKTNAHDDRKLIVKGDFVINSRSDRRGSCGISDYTGSVSLINTVLFPITEMNPRYYNWYFHTVGFADEFYRWGHGIVDDLWTTGWQDMKNILISVPPLDEQQRIADYLDSKCAEIDNIITEKKQQIETIEEYKKSLIFEYVTGKKEVQA
uniref:restriction endonuclease subunit S n=1 Tax=Ruminococcus bicirculans (ex Wegman et al. 2014) TaxID=1160721 RepID=UPI0040264553